MTYTNAIIPNTNPDLVAVIGDHIAPIVAFQVDPTTAVGAAVVMAPTGQTVRVIDIDGAQVVDLRERRLAEFRALVDG